ncbi:TPA: phage major capsid protein, P2 family [Vibrio parahaemolyticus]|uniref:phage major capsid protein, P2 family n=3 Tax=Vibrio parahaemolyticus TaxID=670 RepID=UPI0002A56489|nr:phage major capsid protein, P2 family [Vibrio parahaemolyticus]AGB11020.1 Phage major capsid protein [Vibrio parahaemolyticus BB22OP]MBE4138091.1 phage major capsid protein, P2 family [Vibrio parahaemolyticus]TOZ80026.1 phage major capsid protein, P2 family [Vibrio parahaemolyticus]HCH3319030.1 phage major capsid protein, P2 family [Vibrio parahaemolyticus]HCH6587261.1 phage major capsid protein, P2 family [Vibrio parahaemolyticus]
MSQILTQSAREYMDHFAAQLAKSYGVSTVQELFNVSPQLETQLRAAIVESAAFLQTITVTTVDQIEGQVVDVGVSGLYTGRKSGGRFTKQVGVGGHKYKLAETDSCAAITWAMLCQWANQGGPGKFMKLLTEFSNQMFALDIMRVGWNGVSAEANTDPDTNPLGQDVNEGWYHYVKNRKASQIVDTDVYFDNEGDYKTLDAMASDIINNQIHPMFRNDPRLTVYVGSGLISAAQYKLYDKADTPTEQIAAQKLDKSIAGRPAYVPPFFPENGMLVTIPANLQVLTQHGTAQRKAKHEGDRKQFENSYWRMEGYAVGVLEAFAAYNPDKIHLAPKPVV